MGESVDHKIGSLDARVENLEEDRARLLDTLQLMAARLTEIEKTLASAGGSWRALVAIGALISVVSGAIGAFFAHR